MMNPTRPIPVVIRRLALLAGLGLASVNPAVGVMAGPAVSPATSPATRPVTISAHADRASGVYRTGEEIVFSVALKDAPGDARLEYTLKAGGDRQLATGAIGNDGRVTARADAPGTLLLEVRAKDADGKIVAKGLAGAAIDPDRIELASPEPADFWAFWQSKLEELAAVPIAAKVEPVQLPAGEGLDGVRYEKVTLQNIRGTHVYGQLARPSAEGKYPAVLVVQWAGVYPLQRAWVTDRAKDGWLALNVIAHDVPFDLSAEEFKKLGETTLKDYLYQGMEDREKNYYLRMYLGCHRAAEYLTTRDDWDGRVLVVTGGSQGGMQAIVAAALHPKVTAAIVNMPAGADVSGYTQGRATGYPYWFGRTKYRAKDAAAILATAPYYDIAYFASRIKVPTLVGLGLIDVTCPPAGVYAMANQLRGPREVVTMPESSHAGPHTAYQARSKAWLDAIKAGDAPPAVLPAAPR